MSLTQARSWLPSYLLPFFTLSHRTSPPARPDSFPKSPYYDVGWNDVLLVVTIIAFLAVLRDLLRLRVFESFATWWLTPRSSMNGTKAANGYSPAKMARKRRRSVLRFGEQGWSFTYYTFSWLHGLYVYRNLPTYPFETKNMWIGYPHTPLAWEIKFYYLFQTAFYCHSVLVLNAEAHRKDHAQMMSHHFVTIALLVISFTYNLTRIGCVILFLMDPCDILFSLAKMLRYLGLGTLCDTTFGLFLVTWLATRQVGFFLVLWSAMTEPYKYLAFDWVPAKGYYFTEPVYWINIALLWSLQIMQCVWFWMICRVAWRVVSGQGAEDTRSDSEDSDAETELKPSAVAAKKLD